MASATGQLSTFLRVHVVTFIVIGVLLGVGTVVGKIGLAGTDPIVVAFLRDAMAAVILAIWAGLVEGKPAISSQSGSAKLRLARPFG